MKISLSQDVLLSDHCSARDMIETRKPLRLETCSYEHSLTPDRLPSCDPQTAHSKTHNIHGNIWLLRPQPRPSALPPPYDVLSNGRQRNVVFPLASMALQKPAPESLIDLLVKSTRIMSDISLTIPVRGQHFLLERRLTPIHTRLDGRTADVITGRAAEGAWLEPD